MEMLFRIAYRRERQRSICRYPIMMMLNRVRREWNARSYGVIDRGLKKEGDATTACSRPETRFRVRRKRRAFSAISTPGENAERKGDGRVLKNDSYTCMSRNSNRPDWREALEECTIGLDEHFVPDFCVALVGPSSIVHVRIAHVMTTGTKSDKQASYPQDSVDNSTVVEGMSEYFVRRRWPAAGAVVRTLDDRRPPGIQLCLGTLAGTHRGNVLLPVQALPPHTSSTHPWSEWLDAGADEDNDAYLFLLLATRNLSPDFLTRDMRPYIERGSNVAIGTANHVDDHNGAAAAFVGSQVFRDGVGGFALPRGSDDFVLDVVSSVYGDAGWGMLGHTGDDGNGFQCDAKAMDALFSPLDMDAAENNGDHNVDTRHEDDVEDEMKMRHEFQQFQREMEEMIESMRRDEDEDYQEGDDDVHDFEDAFEEDEEEYHSADALPLYSALDSNENVPVIDGSRVHVEVGETAEMALTTPALLMTAKHAVATRSNILVIPHDGRDDGMGMMASVEDLRQGEDGTIVAVLRGERSMRCYRLWCIPSGFGALCGSVSMPV